MKIDPKTVTQASRPQHLKSTGETPVLLSLVLLLFVSVTIQCKPRADISAIARPVHLDSYMRTKLESELLEYRQTRDQYFKTASDSPIPVELRPAFQSLEYYSPDWKYRFEGPVRRYPNPQKFQMIETTGEWRDAIKYGYVQFQMEGTDFRLEVYRLLDLEEKNMLFIPFVDSNVGKETYDAGRYIDLIEKPNGVYVIDFNRSYNPSCAYGGKYACPVTPQENHLKIAIPAGEKILPLAAHLEKAKNAPRSGG